jgi:hypothetical protein
MITVQNGITFFPYMCHNVTIPDHTSHINSTLLAAKTHNFEVRFVSWLLKTTQKWLRELWCVIARWRRIVRGSTATAWSRINRVLQHTTRHWTRHRGNCRRDIYCQLLIPVAPFRGRYFQLATAGVGEAASPMIHWATPWTNHKPLLHLRRTYLPPVRRQVRVWSCLFTALDL